MAESALYGKLMLLASRLGHRLFRNNSGLAFYANGDPVKYGVASPGGSDLIGWTRTIITAEMVGQTLALFTAVECKSKTGRLTKEQAAFLAAVRDAGGIAILAKSNEDYERGLSGDK